METKKEKASSTQGASELGGLGGQGLPTDLTRWTIQMAHGTMAGQAAELTWSQPSELFVHYADGMQRYQRCRARQWGVQCLLGSPARYAEICLWAGLDPKFLAK
jgi:hypothetical protein